MEAKSRKSYPVRITVDRGKVAAGTLMIPMDITLDGSRQGQRFDFLAQARPR